LYWAVRVLTVPKVKGGHWLIDSNISTPMAKWAQYRGSRTSWGINVLGSFCVEIEATDGTKGFATGFGGPPACWLTHQHFERFLIGEGTDYADMYNRTQKLTRMTF
jgi:L-rhamnonate dehydratase